MKKRVYKFMAGHRHHLESLEQNTVYFSNVKQLNDPYEGLLHFSIDSENISDDLRVNAVAKNFLLERPGELQNLDKAKNKVIDLKNKIGKDSLYHT